MNERDPDETEVAEEPGDDADAAGVTMELWTRRPVCGPRTEVVHRLGEFRAAGTIAEFTVRTWPDEVVLTGHTEDDRVVEAFEAFRAWADDHGVSVTPPFERRTVTSLVGRSEEVLTVPVLCLAVYDDGLAGVYPCQDGDRTVGVTDFLDAFAEEGGVVEPGAVDGVG
ncbi:MAG: HTH domain-containing protein [Haloarculaceae archaeon]